LEIPSVDEPIEVTASAQLVRDGQVGFAIVDFASMKSTLTRIAALGMQIASPKPTSTAIPIPRAVSTTPIPRALSRPPSRVAGKPTTIFKGKLKVPNDARSAIDVLQQPAQSFDACGGWFVRILEFLVRQNDYAIAMFTKSEVRLTVWIQQGRVAFTRLDPSEESDRIGSRLVQDKRISRRTLDQALEKQKVLNEPLGRTLAGMGALQQGQVH